MINISLEKEKVIIVKCIACNQEIIENSPFCPYCGEPQPVIKTVAAESEQEKHIVDEKDNSYITQNESISDITESKNIVIDNTPAEQSEIESANVESEKKEDIIEDVLTISNDDSKNFNKEIFEKDKESNDEWILPSDIVSEHHEEKTLEPTEQESDTIPTSEKKKIKPFFKNKEKEDETSRSESIVNKDGYYNGITPVKAEKFPISKGEFFAKFIFLAIILISIALFLMYVIQ